MRALTPKQERFVQELVRGCSQREAYRAAYDCARSSDRAVDTKACTLFATEKIRGRYDELQAEAAAGAIYDRRRAIADLTEIVDIGLAHVRATKDDGKNFTDKGSRELADLPRGAATVLSAIEKLDKLLGLSQADGDGKVAVIDDV